LRQSEIGEELLDAVNRKGDMIMEMNLRQSLEFAEDIINTVREPLIALDQDLRVVSASRSFYEFFQVKPEETVGQLIYDLGNKQWNIPKLRELLENILPEHSTFDNYEVEHNFAIIGRRTMLLNARQIEQVLGKERIILLAIENISERKAIETGLEKTRKELAVIKKSADEAHEFADSVINTVREPLISLDQDLRVVTVSRSFYDFFKVKPEETVGQLIYDLGNQQWDIPKLRELLETILPQKTSFDGYEVEHDFASIGRRTMLLNARQIEQVLGKERIILLAIEDITERKAIETGLETTRKELAVIKKSADAAHEFADSVINTVREPLISLDQDLRVVTVNRSFYEFFQVKPEETVGQLIYDLGNQQWDIPKLRELLETILPQKTSFDGYEVEHDFATIGRRTMLLNARQIEQAWGKERIILLAIEDITERSRLEDLLEESEFRYRRLFETASDGIVLLEKQKGHVAHANPAIEEILGYSEAECLGKNLNDIGISIDEREFSATMQDLNREGILNYEDVLLKTRSGKEIFADIYMVNRAQLAQCNIRDVSDRILAEKILTEEKKFIENALNTLTDVFFAFSLSGRFLRWNKMLNKVTGYLDTEIESMKPAGLFRGDDIRRFAAAVQMAIDEGNVNVNALLVSKDGKQTPYSFNAALLRDTSANPIAICGIGRDITERIQREQDLHSAFIKAQEGENRWEAIMSSMGDGISIQNSDYIITYQNQALQDLVGAHVGEHCYTAYECKDHICERCPVELAFNDGGIHKAERTVTVGKETKYREVIASPLKNIRGEIVSVVEVIRDITERKKLESQLLHAQKMEAVGTLVGGISHDFNNILNVILGYGDMVMASLAAGSRAREDMSEVLVAAERAADLTKRLLVFSRREPVNMEPVNINELILLLQKMLVRIIRESIDFQLNLTDTTLTVLADAGQIEQVLINLAANAKDVMPDGGQLIISTGLEEMDEEFIAAYGYGSPGKYALITVADTGQGMNKETQQKIFEPFFTTKEVGKGTGLGLAISFGIIKQHGGYIRVYSEPGEGSIFKIHLPLCDLTAQEKQPVVLAPVKGGNETILVAEDESTLRDLSKIVLESFGYTVITAEDGEVALAKFLENKELISLVLLDMIMPKKSGEEVGEAIRKVRPMMKILFSSGYIEEIITKKEMTEDGFNFIQKPYLPKNLLLKVREVLDQ
jgi:PAS domain S-box-containing protein